MIFKHYVSTKFNRKRGNSDINLNEKWLETRFELFDQICFPSIVNQTNKNFTWIIGCDPNTPQKFKDLFMEYEKKSQGIIYINYTLGVPEIINNELPKPPDYVIVSKVDNDDALRQNYIELMQSKFNYQIEPEIYDFVNGYNYYNGNMYLVDTKLTPYATSIQKYENGVTPAVYGKHRKLSSRSIYHKINDIRGWISTIHDTNASNRKKAFNRKSKRISIEQILKEFCLNIK